VLPPEVGEHVGESLPERVEFRLAPGADGTASAAHQRVEVRREGHPVEPWAAVGVQDQRQQVLVVEVTVGHRHRLAPVGAHHGQGRCVVLRIEQAHLPADELGVGAGPAHPPQVLHLPSDLLHRVRSVDPDPVGVGGVVARAAGRIAPREHPVGALAADRAAAQQLVLGLHVLRQRRPARVQRRSGLGVHRAGQQFDGAPPRGERRDRGGPVRSHRGTDRAGLGSWGQRSWRHGHRLSASRRAQDPPALR
jgi:hypothetical protein